MTKRNPFLKQGTLNGKPHTFDNTNQGTLDPRFDIREGALMGSFNHGPTGKKLTTLAVPSPGGYTLVLHEGAEIYARGELKRAGGKIAFTGTVGEDIKIVAFTARRPDGSRYLQLRPDRRNQADVEAEKAQAQAVLSQLDLPM